MTIASRDLEFLVRCFQEVLGELGERDIAARLPWCGRPEAATTDGGLAERLPQAYSTAFALLNMVEENTYAQNHRRLSAAGRLRERSGSWEHTFALLRRAGIEPDEIAEVLPEVRVEPVLTAHPTQARRRTILEHHRRLYRLVVEGENQMWTPGERHEIRERIKATLETLWRSGEITRERPDVASEVRNVLHYLRNVFPTVLPILIRRLRDAWIDAGFDPASIDDRAPLLPNLHFGNWVGGDRDGHPFVTADVTRDTLAQLRGLALDLLRGRLGQLAASLSLSLRLETPGTTMMERLSAMRDALGAAGAAAIARNSGEPWRQYVNLMLALLPVPGGDTAAGPGSGPASAGPRYPGAEALLADLELLRADLVARGGRRLARSEVTEVIELVRLVGFHGASLDVRQNSRFHDTALAQLLTAAGIDAADFADWDEPRRLALIEAELAIPRPFVRPGAEPEAEARTVLDCYRVLAQEVEARGTAGLGALIVSMTRSLSDLLIPYLFAREVGLLVREDGEAWCRLPVVPLFETIDDLGHSPATLAAFLAHPITRASLRRQATRSGRDRLSQQVMIGYSDSNKDGGILASQWGLIQAQAALISTGTSAGVHIRFFHGRGGTISRGAGPTHRFMDALPCGSVDGDLRLTEQGETIAQKYANRITAAHNLELLTAGAVRRTLLDRLGCEIHPLASVMDRLATDSRHAYQELISRPDFIVFFGEATPIDVIEQARIGSRPARRTGRRTLTDLRAIPWVFGWSQARFHLSGWYGVGHALARLQADDADGWHALAGAVRDRSWASLNYIVGNVTNSVMTADADLMTAHAGLVQDPAIRERFLQPILEEYATTRRLMETLLGRALEDERPALARSVALRAPALRVLHAEQIRLLRQWRAARAAGDETAAEGLLDRLLVVVNALASGLGTTG